MNNQKLTPELREFFRELAQLMEKYSVTIEGSEKTRNYETFCDGIDFSTDWSLKDGEVTQEPCCVKLGKYLNFDDIKKVYEQSI